MSQTMFMSISTINSAMFSKMKHPMSMGMSLLMQTVIMCMLTGTMSQNLWFSYILFLVFLGGMLVLFIYMTSVASNEMFQKMSNKTMMITMLLMTIMLTVMTLNDEITMKINNSMESLNTYTKMSESEMMTSLFNYPTNLMTMFAVIYLFLTLIVVVNITESHQGPLRSKN